MVELPSEVIWGENCSKVSTIIQIIAIDNSIVKYLQSN